MVNVRDSTVNACVHVCGAQCLREEQQKMSFRDRIALRVIARKALAVFLFYAFFSR